MRVSTMTDHCLIEAGELTAARADGAEPLA